MGRVIRLRDVSTGKDREFVSSCTLLGRNGRTGGDVPQGGASPADSSPDGSPQLGRGGVSVGIILMVGGLLGLLVSVLFWSSLSPWSRRRTVAGDAVVEERRIERELL